MAINNVPPSQHIKAEIWPADPGKPIKTGFLRQLFGGKFLFGVNFHTIEEEFIELIRGRLLSEGLRTATSAITQQSSSTDIIRYKKQYHVLEALLKESEKKYNQEVKYYDAPDSSTVAKIAELNFEIEQCKAAINELMRCKC